MKFILLISVLGAFVLPLLVIITTSLSTRSALTGTNFIPHELTFSNFIEISKQYPIAHWALNTIFVASLSVIGGLISSVSVAYALTHFQWKGKNLVIWLVGISFLIPVQITTISLYKIYAGLGWIPSFKALIVPFFLTDPISVIILRQFLLQIPLNLTQVARIDGVSELKIFISVVLPLLKPALIANGLLIFLGSWNDLYQPLLFTIEDPNLWTLPIGLSQIQGIHNANPNLTMAAAAIFILPVIFIFLIAQKRLLNKLDYSSQIIS